MAKAFKHVVVARCPFQPASNSCEQIAEWATMPSAARERVSSSSSGGVKPSSPAAAGLDANMLVPVARAVRMSARRVGSEQGGIAVSSSELMLSTDGVALRSDSDMA